MKKSKILGIIGVGALSLLPFGISAASNATATISCPDTAKPGEEISCTINIRKDGANISGLAAKYDFATGVTKKSLNLNFNPDVNVQTENGFAIGKTSGLGANVNIGTLKVQMPANANSNATFKVGLKDLDISSGDDSYDIASASDTVRIKSSINTLSVLTVDGENYLNVTDTKNIDKASINIVATAADSHASVVGAGVKKLSYGLNTFEIKVTSEIGEVKTYTIKINRPDNRKTDKDLLGFGFLDKQIDFNKDKLNYTLTVENNVLRLFEIAGIDKNNNGDTLYLDTKQIDSNGESIKIIFNGQEIDFKALQEAVDKDCDENGKCIYKIDGEIIGEYDPTNLDEYYFKLPYGELKVGENKLEIVVIAENETTKTYTFTITRKAAEKVVENPKTGLFIGVGTVGFIGIISAGLYFLLKKKNAFPKA